MDPQVEQLWQMANILGIVVVVAVALLLTILVLLVARIRKRVAAIKATEHVYKVKPDLTREGGSIPVTLTFAEKLGVNVLLLPMGRGDDGAQ